MIAKGILRIALLLSLVGIVYSISSIFINIYAYKESEEKYTQLKEVYVQANSRAKADVHKEFGMINEDYIGWLTVDGTSIDYPVVQGVDNDFYLDHNFYREGDWVGAIYMDYRNGVAPLDDHSIIYGHNMKDNSMFGTLVNVLGEEFSEGSRIRFETRENVYEWEVFSAYQTRVTDWMKVDFENQLEYEQFTEQLVQASEKKFQDEKIAADEKIITLATCTGRYSDERTIVHARLVKGNN